MRDFLRAVFTNVVSLSWVAAVFPGLSYGNDVATLAVAALSFTLINYYLKPIIKLFLLPINLITLGMFRWLTGVICLFALTVLIPGITIAGYRFPGFTGGGFALPPVNFTVLLSIITASLLLSLTASLITWITKG